MVMGQDAATGALLASSVLLVILAAGLLVGHRLRPAWGLGWMALAMAVTAVRALGSASGLVTWPAWPAVAGTLAAATLSALHVGVRAYTDRPLRQPLLWFAGAIPLWFALRAGLQALGLGDMAGPGASGVLFVYLAAQCATRLRDYAGGAYSLAVTVLLAHPVVVLGIGAGLYGADARTLRAWAVCGIAAVALGLLMAAMGRLRVDLEREAVRRRQAEDALREANAQLEQRVQERTVELEQLVSDLDSFNRMVSHDLRGPLGGLKGLAELTQQSLQEGDHERVARHLDIIQQEADRLGQLVTRLLELARVTHAQLERRDTALDEVLGQALASLRLSLGAERVACVTADPLPRATVDAGLMQQVFVNLLGNAIKFAGAQAQPAVYVHGQGSSRYNRQVLIEVRDNGPGFEPEQAKELFQPFKRLHGSAVEGCGIGLTIVRRIVERHGGTVWAEGRPGQGASFFVSLPA